MPLLPLNVVTPEPMLEHTALPLGRIPVAKLFVPVHSDGVIEKLEAVNPVVVPVT